MITNNRRIRSAKKVKKKTVSMRRENEKIVGKRAEVNGLKRTAWSSFHFRFAKLFRYLESVHGQEEIAF